MNKRNPIRTLVCIIALLVCLTILGLEANSLEVDLPVFIFALVMAFLSAGLLIVDRK